MMHLCHHGIKGMRWGVRRTSEQLGHVRQFADRGKKGYKVQRYSGYKRSDNPSYVFSNSEDSKHYARKVNDLPSVQRGQKSLAIDTLALGPYAYGRTLITKRVKNAKLSTYILNKDAKIAEAKEVTSLLLKRIGKMPAELVATTIDDDNYTMSDYFYSIKGKQKYALTYAQLSKRMAKDNKFTPDDIQRLNNLVISTHAHETMQDVKSYFMKRGYDIIVDPEDVANGFKDPWIVLNPGILDLQSSLDFPIKSIEKYGRA